MKTGGQGPAGNPTLLPFDRKDSHGVGFPSCPFFLFPRFHFFSPFRLKGRDWNFDMIYCFKFPFQPGQSPLWDWKSNGSQNSLLSRPGGMHGRTGMPKEAYSAYSSSIMRDRPCHVHVLPSSMFLEGASWHSWRLHVVLLFAGELRSCFKVATAHHKWFQAAWQDARCGPRLPAPNMSHAEAFVNVAKGRLYISFKLDEQLTGLPVA